MQVRIKLRLNMNYIGKKESVFDIFGGPKFPTHPRLSMDVYPALYIFCLIYYEKMRSASQSSHENHSFTQNIYLWGYNVRLTESHQIFDTNRCVSIHSASMPWIMKHRLDKKKENYPIFLPYQFHWRAHSVGGDSKRPNKKMKTMFLSNMSKSRRLTSTFFSIRGFVCPFPPFWGSNPSLDYQILP